MKVSAIYSIYNRSKLFARGLATLARQSMSPRDWELVLVDDGSTEDLSEVYKPYLGQLNIRHVRIDHTRHEIFKAMNPGWAAGNGPPLWYHTPAISTNVGVCHARGEVLLLAHPEILHAPANLQTGYEAVRLHNAFVFGKCWLGRREGNGWLDKNPVAIERLGFKTLLDRVNQAGPMRHFQSAELYWYVSFVARAAAEAIGGVDLEYQRGVCGEDDDFRERLVRAGVKSMTDWTIEGIHQNHDDEQDLHRLRHTERWRAGQVRNRDRFYSLKSRNGLPVNQGRDWRCPEVVESVEEFLL